MEFLDWFLNLNNELIIGLLIIFFGIFILSARDKKIWPLIVILIAYIAMAWFLPAAQKIKRTTTYSKDKQIEEFEEVLEK